MEIIQIVGLGLITALMSLLIKEQKPQFALLLALVFGTGVFLFLASKIGAVIAVMEDLAVRSSIDIVFLKTILKIIGIAYIAEFGAQIIRDSGHESIAAKVEMAGKILIMFMAIPIIRVIIETVVSLLPA